MFLFFYLITQTNEKSTFTVREQWKQSKMYSNIASKCTEQCYVVCVNNNNNKVDSWHCTMMIIIYEAAEYIVDKYIFIIKTQPQ